MINKYFGQELNLFLTVLRIPKVQVENIPPVILYDMLAKEYFTLETLTMEQQVFKKVYTYYHKYGRNGINDFIRDQLDVYKNSP